MKENRPCPWGPLDSVGNITLAVSRAAPIQAVVGKGGRGRVWQVRTVGELCVCVLGGLDSSRQAWSPGAQRRDLGGSSNEQAGAWLWAGGSGVVGQWAIS